MKAPIYDTMSLPPHGIFSLRNKAAHSQRRGLLSHAFSQQNINDCMPIIEQKLDSLLRSFNCDTSQTVDVFLRFRLFAFDVVGELFLGTSFGASEAGTAPEYLHDVDRQFLFSGIKFNFPLLATFLSQIPLSSMKTFTQGGERLAQFGNSAFQEYIQRYGRDSKRRDLLTKVLVPQQKGKAMTDRETYVEVGNLVAAGTDTTSTTLTYLFWSLARFPEWQNHVRKEMHEKLGRAAQGPYEMQALNGLPVVDAVINEALRLYPAAPASLPRVTPQEGWQWNAYTIPPEASCRAFLHTATTVVSMQCYTTQRDPIAFPDPDVFLPGRWLEAEPTTSMKTLFMPFSKGTRACIGKSLAMVELRLVVLGLLSRYEVKLPPQTTEESMEIRDHFLVMPKSGKCELIFEPLPEGALAKA
ncbi:hypothetical protein LTR12_003017 [Friedmanniomyces endolithicus]|nr:hypothetical protein LTS09_008713 [Friedmanniomyces endolithicus]KAK0782619.1 hypothetical protein LTR59_012091 [Friedmanniomyces endolithicus]KAK0784256.1 hypothetical protein LTR75_013886 [Friedmanniomyces endolithicus]KAK0791344.1 hypothetical protein LTR38_010245 [Friedmanniomyces endolithicus]KAK0853514.1 hypothetical protein LTR03_002778 [Friedmanniomyces endolithicus]